MMRRPTTRAQRALKAIWDEVDHLEMHCHGRAPFVPGRTITPDIDKRPLVAALYRMETILREDEQACRLLAQALIAATGGEPVLVTDQALREAQEIEVQTERQLDTPGVKIQLRRRG